MNDKSLRVLMVEDSEDDVLLLMRNLKQGGYNPVYDRVETAAAMKKALKEKQWDIILCDYKMPNFSAPSAIALLNEIKINIPIIIISGTVGEAVAIDCMRLGAQDYIMKDNLSRLCPAIARELENAEIRNKEKQTESQREAALELLRKSEKYYKEITENSSDIIIIADKNGNIKYCSLSIERYTGYKPEELIGKSTLTIIHPADKKRAAVDYGNAVLRAASAIPNSFRIVCKDGSKRYFEGLGKNLLDNPDVEGFIMNVRDITERKESEEELRKSEEKYRTIIEKIHDGYFEVDLTGNMTFFNESMCEIYGYSKEELMGMNHRKYTDEANAEKVFEAFSKIYKTRTTGNIFEYEIIRKDGTRRQIEVSASLIKDSSDKPIGFRGISRDITQRKEAEEVQRESEKKYRDLYDFLPIPVYEMDLEANIISANRAIYEKFGGTEENLKKGFKVWQILTPEAIEKASKNIQKLLNGAPVIRTEHTLKKLDGSEFPAIVISSLSYINDKPVGLRGAIIDITERKQAEVALKESENKYRLLADNIDDVLFILDINLNYTYVSPSVKTLMGYEPEELLTLRLSDTVMHSSWDMALKTFSEIMEMENSGNSWINNPLMIQLEMKRKDGRTVWTEVKCSFIRDENQRPVGIIGVSRDLTERKRVEEELRQSEEKYRTILENIEDGYYETDLAGNFTFFNDSLCLIHGYSKEELMGMNNRQYEDKETLKKVYQTFNKIYKTGEPIKGFDRKIIRKDGIKRYVEVSASLLKDSSGKPIGFSGISRDITERKQMEEMISQSEERYRTILDEMDDGYFEVDLAGNFTFVNDADCFLLGSSREELIGTSFRNHINKEDVETVYSAFAKIYSTGKPERGIYYRGIRKDGTTRFAEISGFPMKNDKGEIIGFRGMALDITARRQMEEELRQSEEKYRTILENMQDAYFEVDDAGNFTFFNDAMCHHFGYSREELMGMNYRQYTDHDNAKKLFQAYHKVYTSGEPIKEHFWQITRKDGTKRYLAGSVSLKKDSQGEPTGFKGIDHDITDRKQTEDKLLLTLESLRKAVGTTIQVLVSALEARDPYTAGHQSRVADLARAIATEMGLDQEKIEGIRMAGSIHDIGKLSIPAEILSKPTKLTNLEFSLIKEHAQSGYEMLKDVESPWPLAQIVYQHHERMNGSGYPQKLKGDEILIEARIMGVADVVEAMASHRPYRAGLGIDAALDEIKKNKGILYDPAVADACLKLFLEKGYQLPLQIN